MKNTVMIDYNPQLQHETIRGNVYFRRLRQTFKNVKSEEKAAKLVSKRYQKRGDLQNIVKACWFNAKGDLTVIHE